MRALKAIGSGIKGFMILFSFIVSLVLVIVLIALGLLIFDIKNNIAQPLVTGLHSSFAGLDESTIDWTIPVRGDVPVQFTVPLETETVVVLTQPVPLSVSANINLPGVGSLNNAQVFLSLPAGLELPVRLDLDVPIDHQLPVSLDVRAVIPISQTQLHDPIQNLQLTFEPIARALYNLPSNFSEAGTMASDVLAGNWPNLLAENDYSRNPWPGFSRTAGVGYELASEPWPTLNVPLETGIVPIGGIPALDEQIRPDVYAAGGPSVVNTRASSSLSGLAVPQWYYDGSYHQVFFPDARTSDLITISNPPPTVAPPQQEGTSDLGILPTAPIEGQQPVEGGQVIVTPVIVPPGAAQPQVPTAAPPSNELPLQSAGEENATQSDSEPPEVLPPEGDGSRAGDVPPSGDLGILPTAAPEGGG
jgi:hypothetical protein